MNRFYAALVMAGAAAFGGWASIAPAKAAPPTVTPSPGYDARLQEQRAAAGREPVIPVPEPVSRRRVKRIHHKMN
jgi:hypothetical protein